jgi:hypothetical protein
MVPTIIAGLICFALGAMIWYSIAYSPSHWLLWSPSAAFPRNCMASPTS